MKWEVELPTPAAKRKFDKYGPCVSGYKTGYGAWVLKPGDADLGDWHDRSSKWHY